LGLLKQLTIPKNSRYTGYLNISLFSPLSIFSSFVCESFLQGGGRREGVACAQRHSHEGRGKGLQFESNLEQFFVFAKGMHFFSLCSRHIESSLKLGWSQYLRNVSGGFVRKPTRVTGYGVNQHRSNRAKNGLYHGKDVQFGNNVSHSIRKTRRRWYPNVINKRVWSESLDEWIRFKMTTRALKEIDKIGGVDNYLVGLDEKSVQESNYITKMRNRVAAAMFHQDQTLLHPQFIKRLGYHKQPPDDPRQEPKEDAR
jgi:large subunit ribosomal protein L28